MGNKGTEQDFLNALVGKPGKDGKTGYIGSDGITGSNGVSGKSAYQLWLDSGHTGSSQVFLDSLAGTAGAGGISGLSAYELWLSIGNNGTVQEFLDSLAGAPGTPGANGTPGQTGKSAYEIWLEQGNTGTAVEFLASLIGAAGAPGPSGAPGEPGATGERGPQGVAGPAGQSGLGYSASYYSTITQTTTAGAIKAMTLNATDWATGITLQNSSELRITNAGKYNLAFSAQMHQTNSSGIVNFWLAKNGVPMAYTNTKLDITSNSPYLVAAWNFFIDASANDVYQLMWSSTNSNTEILAAPAEGSGATLHPAIPSLILTINQVG